MSGDEDDAFREFAEASWTPLVRLGLGLTADRGRAEEAAQDALASVWLRWKRLDLPDAYARRCVVNSCVSVLRRRRSKRELLVGSFPPEALRSEAGLTPDDLGALASALSQLPARQRAVVFLRYVEELSEAEVSAMLDCSVGSVKSQASRGLQRLRQLYPDPTTLVSLGAE